MRCRGTWPIVLVFSCAALAVGVPARAGEATATAAPVGHFEPAVCAEDVRGHIEYLAGPALRGRSGREGRLAAEYIRRHLERCGAEPLFAEGWFQEIPGAADEDGRRTVLGRNVGGWIPGSDPELRGEFVIVSAHYDHLGVRDGKLYAGADDNASGVSMMLEVARQISRLEIKPRRSVVFIGFDLEEHMLWGSRWFVAHPPWPLRQVKLFITADMIGRSLGDLPLPTVFVLGSEHAPAVRERVKRIGTPEGLEVALLGVDLIGTRSDYGPFRDKRIPFLFFSTGEHPDYHTPRDVPERIDCGKVSRVSSLVLNVCRDVADADEPPAWTDDVQPSLDEARALHRITTLLLEGEQADRLTGVQRLLVSQARLKTKQILERGEITEGERSSLIRLSQLMLLSVF